MIVWLIGKRFTRSVLKLHGTRLRIRPKKLLKQKLLGCLFAGLTIVRFQLRFLLGLLGDLVRELESFDLNRDHGAIGSSIKDQNDDFSVWPLILFPILSFMPPELLEAVFILLAETGNQQNELFLQWNLKSNLKFLHRRRTLTGAQSFFTEDRQASY